MNTTLGRQRRRATRLDQALPSTPLSWAERLKRVFDIDISVCPLCCGKDPVKGRKTISLPLSDGSIHGSAFIPTPSENYVG